MLLSIGIILIVGGTLGYLFKLIKLPPLLGMIIGGIILGTSGLNVIDENILNISADIRKIALVIILSRAGLGFSFTEIKKMGSGVCLLSFLPAVCEICGYMIFAPLFLHLTLMESLLLGTVMSAVSPAVIVPAMLKITSEGYGTNKKTPQMVLLGASIDDIFVMTLFSIALSIVSAGKVDMATFISLPTSIIFGIIAGIIAGSLLSFIFKKIKVSPTIKSICFFALAITLTALEQFSTEIIGFSGIMASMVMGITLKKTDSTSAEETAKIFAELWKFAQIFLFVLVGIAVQIKFASSLGFTPILIIFICLAFRFIGVILSTLKANLTKKEVLFACIAFSPKATVQAGIGGTALALGLACGNTVLTIAVISILVTAPLGDKLISLTYKKLLTKDLT